MKRRRAGLARCSWNGRGGLVLWLAAVLAVSGCSYVPDWANPVSWYDRVFTEDEISQLSQSGREQVSLDSESDGFPRVAEVPREVPVADREVDLNQLLADRENARLTNETLREGGEVPMPSITVAGVGVAEPLPQLQVSEQPGVPTLAQPVPPNFEGGPQVTPLLRDGPEPVEPAVPFAGEAAQRGLEALVQAVPPAMGVPERPQASLPEPTPAFEPITPSTSVVPAPQPVPELVPQEQVVQILPPARVEGQDVLAQTFAQMLAQSNTAVHNSVSLPTRSPALAEARPVTMVGAVDPEAFNAVERALGHVATPLSSDIPVVGGDEPVRVQFSHDSVSLSAIALGQIRKLAERYSEVGGRVRVVGHASSRTRDMPVAQHMMANFNVSVDRAQAVAKELMRQGVSPDTLIVDAVGDTQPLLTEVMPAGEAANRRVEIFFLGN